MAGRSAARIGGQPVTAPLAFVDTETTHLSAELGEVWEVAVILRETVSGVPAETEYVWQLRPHLATADKEALEVGRYLERFVVPPHAEAAWTGDDEPLPMPRATVRHALTNVLSGAVLIGSNPAFDDRFLRKLLGDAPWHYRPVCVATLAAGYVRGLAAETQLAEPGVYFPFSSRDMSRAVGVEPPGEGVAHTALGDARHVRDVYDAVMGGAS